MTGQNLLAIITILCFIVPILLHLYKKIELYDKYDNILISTIHAISMVTGFIWLIVIICLNWNTPIF